MPYNQQNIIEGSIERERPASAGAGRRGAAGGSERLDRGFAVAAVLHAIPVFVWAVPVVLLFGFIIMALVYQRGHLEDFTSGVLLWLSRGLIAGGVVLGLVAAVKIYQLYHTMVLDHSTRRIQAATVRKQVAAARGAELKNEQLEVKIDLERKLPELMAWALQNGYAAKYNKDGLELYQAPGAGGLPGLAGDPRQDQKQIAGPAVEKPSVDYLASLVEPNSDTLALGINVDTREPIIAELDGVNVLVIGRTQMGKSSLVGGLLTQITQTHDLAHMKLVILDLENKTGRLFDGNPHILQLRMKGEVHTLHARSDLEVVDSLIVLGHYMEWRYQKAAQYGEAWMEEQPRVLIYFEEFLQWRKTIKPKLKKEQYERVMAAFFTLASRGLKVRMNFMVCAQVNYADEELKDAMAQLTGIRVSLAVSRTAAQAAGFVETEMLNRVYREGVKGQFLVEKAGGGEIGMAANFDARALVKGLKPAPGSFAALAADAAETGDGDLEENRFTVHNDQSEEASEEEEQEAEEEDGAAFPAPTPALSGDLRIVYDAVQQLVESGRRVSARELEALTGFKKDKANNLLNRLESLGYINRRAV